MELHAMCRGLCTGLLVAAFCACVSEEHHALPTAGALTALPCTVADDCVDENHCTSHYCLDGTCHSEWTADCCWAPEESHPETGLSWLDEDARQAFADSQCDDDNACTCEDSCDLDTNTCQLSESVPGCCLYDKDCEPDVPLYCWEYKCVAHRCTESLRYEGCCMMPSDPGYDSLLHHPDIMCDDGKPCFSEWCDSHSCRNYYDPAVCCVDDQHCKIIADDDNPCTDEKCYFNTTLGLKLCQPFYQDLCSQTLPYAEDFDSNFYYLQSGWTFKDYGAYSLKHWSFGSDGLLGPDNNILFQWNPTTSPVKAVAVSPLIDASGADDGGLNPEQAVTLQWRMAYRHWDPGEYVILQVVATDNGDFENGDVIWSEVLTGDLDYDLYSYELPVSLKFSTTLQIGLMITTASTFFMDAWVFDDVLVAAGVPNKLKLTRVYHKGPTGWCGGGIETLMEESTNGVPDLFMRADEHYRWVLCYEDLDTDPTVYAYWGRPHAHLDGAPMDTPEFITSTDQTGFGSGCYTNAAGVNAMCGQGMADYYCVIDVDPLGLESNLGTFHVGIVGQDAWNFDPDKNTHSPLQSLNKTTVTVLPVDGYLVWSPMGESHPSALAIKKVINGWGRKATIITSLSVFPDLSDYDGIFATLGVKGYGHDLTAGETQILREYLDGGGRLYLESGNFWYSGSSESASDLLEAYFMSEGLWNGLAVNDGPLSGANFLYGMGFEYDDSPVFNHYNNGLTHVLQKGALELMHDKSNPGFAVVVANEEAAWRVIGSSVLFGGLKEMGLGSRDYLMNRYLYFLENGLPTCSLDEQCDDFEVCTTDTCDPAMGCVHLQVDCDDINPCTIDYCLPESGQAVCFHNESSGDDVYCTICSTDAECNTLESNPSPPCVIGECIDTPGSGTRLCEDQSDCPTGVCEDGVCIVKACEFHLRDCNDGDGCTKDTCDPKWSADGISSGCNHKNICGGCPAGCSDDDNPCTETVCNNGLCMYPIKDCDDQNPDTNDYCDLTTGDCVFEVIPLVCATDDDCMDQNTCTVNEFCYFDSEFGDQLCTSDSVICEDGDACTTDQCDPNLGCVSTDIPGCRVECPEGDDAYCHENNPYDDPCTVDTCEKNEADGKFYCHNVTKDCDDGNDCTIDYCDGYLYGIGLCTHIPMFCDDNKPCTVDSCNSETEECSHKPMKNCCSTDADCDDSNHCTTETCDPVDGTCDYLTTPDCNPCWLQLVDPLSCTCFTKNKCDDDDWTTVDYCNPWGHCSHWPYCGYSGGDEACSWGNPCIVGCHRPDCSCEFGPLDCDDGNPCTNDWCDPEGLSFDPCVNEPVNCDSQDPCLLGYCEAATGTCLTSEKCETNNPCITESCNPLTGECTYDFDGDCPACSTDQDCDDNNLCTVEYCDSLLDACRYELVNCNDGICFTEDSCDPVIGCVWTPIDIPCLPEAP